MGARQSIEAEAWTPVATVPKVRLTPPTTGTFTLSVLAIVAGVATHFGYIEILSPYEFWLLAGGAALLIAGVVFRKL